MTLFEKRLEFLDRTKQPIPFLDPDVPSIAKRAEMFAAYIREVDLNPKDYEFAVPREGWNSCYSAFHQLVRR